MPPFSYVEDFFIDWEVEDLTDVDRKHLLFLYVFILIPFQFKASSETYLKPLGIKSMLDVPIMHKNKMIGVICIESLTTREWNGIEVNFAELLSSIYSFSYSIKETNDLNKKIVEIIWFLLLDF